MGLSSSKTTNKPIYNQQIEGAAKNVTDTQNQVMPGLLTGAEQFGGVRDASINKYMNGDPMVDAGKSYNTSVLNGDYLDQGNPYLQSIIDKSNNDLMNQQQALYGTRGLTGGSDYSIGISRALDQNSNNLRYNDYNSERDRMAQAVSQVPGLISAENGLLDPALSAYDAQQAPLRASIGASGAIGGLLGQYQTVKQSSNIGAMLAQAAANAAAAYAGSGGGFGGSSGGLSTSNGGFDIKSGYKNGG